MIEAINRHERIALHVSGGKDSLACLFVTRQYWDRLTVYWVNTGAAFPETVEQMERIRAMVPRFVEVQSNQPHDMEETGYPVDVLPVRNVQRIAPFVGGHEVKLQAFWECCVRNVMAPMHQRMIADGITLIVRGQRAQERLKSTVRSGDVVDGIEFLFPIEDWDGDQVRAYLADKPIGLPRNYADMDTSLDCWSCTAYLSENIGKRGYMKREHPDLYQIVSERLAVISREVGRETEYLRQAIGA